MPNLRQRKGGENNSGGPFSGRFNPKLGKKGDPGGNSPESKKPYLSNVWWSRIVMLGSVFLIAYYSSFTPKSTIMAKQSETLTSVRYQNFLCPPTFKSEIRDTLSNERCVPFKCGRGVVDNIVSSEDAYRLLSIAKKGFALGGSAGGASTLDLHSGALSKGNVFIDFYASHPGVFTPDDFAVYNSVKDAVKIQIAQHFQIDPSSLYLSYPTFFSRITNKPAKTMQDEYWHPHIDKETYPSFHYTSLLYLTDYGEDFQGGTFVFIDAKLNRTIEPKFGRVSMFTSGMENRHHVEPVTGGTRYALTMGFTCDKSKAIQDPGTSRARQGDMKKR